MENVSVDNTRIDRVDTNPAICQVEGGTAGELVNGCFANRVGKESLELEITSKEEKTCFQKFLYSADQCRIGVKELDYMQCLKGGIFLPVVFHIQPLSKSITKAGTTLPPPKKKTGLKQQANTTMYVPPLASYEWVIKHKRNRKTTETKARSNPFCPILGPYPTLGTIASGNFS